MVSAERKIRYAVVGLTVRSRSKGGEAPGVIEFDAELVEDPFA